MFGNGFWGFWGQGLETDIGFGISRKYEHKVKITIKEDN
jgi:hypothetical protein